MILFFICTLCVSIVGMVSTLALKRYELASGSVLFASMRPPVGGFFRGISRFLRRTIPLVARDNRRRAAEIATMLWRYAIAQAGRGIEYMLEQILHIVREKTSIERSPGEASAFLREVSEHKKQLVRDDAKEYLE